MLAICVVVSAQEQPARLLIDSDEFRERVKLSMDKARREDNEGGPIGFQMYLEVTRDLVLKRWLKKHPDTNEKTMKAAKTYGDA